MDECWTGCFRKIDQILARDTLLTYQYFNEILKIHNDASKFQLGEDISQKVKLIAFFSRKLTDSQQWYMVT